MGIWTFRTEWGPFERRIPRDISPRTNAEAMSESKAWPTRGVRVRRDQVPWVQFARGGGPREWSEQSTVRLGTDTVAAKVIRVTIWARSSHWGASFETRSRHVQVMFGSLSQPAALKESRGCNWPRWTAGNDQVGSEKVSI
jgi:hypothetical protein